MSETSETADRLKLFLRNAYAWRLFDEDARPEVVDEVEAIAKAEGAVTVKMVVEVPTGAEDRRNRGYTVARALFARFGTKEKPEWLVFLVDLEGVVQVVRPFTTETRDMAWLKKIILTKEEFAG